MLGGGIGIFILAPWETLSLFSSVFDSPDRTALLAYELVISTSIAWWLNYASLQRLPVSATATFGFLQVPITGALSYLLYRQTPGNAYWVVSVLVVVSCYLVIGEAKEA